ncbi:MAG: hypothetical protein LBB59_07975 [Campylobacteraceae bacterium]|nr:hypothetical protein [Campylobacteraceae bacterium]
MSENSRFYFTVHAFKTGAGLPILPRNCAHERIFMIILQKLALSWRRFT